MSIQCDVASSGGWIKCRRSLRIRKIAQNKAAPREPYEAVVVRVYYGPHSADVLMPTGESLKSILHSVIELTSIPLRARNRGMTMPFLPGEVCSIGIHEQAWITIEEAIRTALILGGMSRDPRFETTARSAAEVTGPIDLVPCVLQVHRDE